MTELYDRLAQRFPSEWGPSSDRAAHAGRYRENFEKAFTEIDLGRAPDLPPGVRGAPGLTAIESQRPLTIYFSEFRIDGTRKDLYSRLLDYLQRSKLIEASFFSSLNYECLFEQASLRTGRRIEYLLEAAAAPMRGMITDDWPGARQSADINYLLKLHGSCNFSTQVDQMLMAQLSTGAHVEVRIDSSDPFATLTESTAARIFPVMTQTSPDRDNFLASAKMFQIRQIWDRAISHASLIVVIGVAPRRYDEHIWNPLSAATGDIVYIGARRDADAWRECNARFRSLGATFCQGFRPLLRCLAAHRKRRDGGLWNYLLDTCRAWLT
jgi:hypothetical protein